MSAEKADQAARLRKDFSARSDALEGRIRSAEQRLKEIHKEMLKTSAMKTYADRLEDRIYDIMEKQKSILRSIAYLKKENLKLEDEIKVLKAQKREVKEIDGRAKKAIVMEESLTAKSGTLEHRIRDLEKRTASSKELHDMVVGVRKTVSELEEMQKKAEGKMEGKRQRISALSKGLD